MSFLFKRNKHGNAAKDGQRLVGDHTSKKLHKNSRRHNSTRRPPTSMSSAMLHSKSVSNTTKSSPKAGLSKDTVTQSRSNSNGPSGMADIVLDPLQYTELLLQASAARDWQQAQDQGYGDLEVPPPTPLRRHSTRGERQYHSRPHPQSHVPRAVGNFTVVDAIVEGVTYDAILASTVNRKLNRRSVLTEEDGTLVNAPPPETKVPPNSPAVSVRLRRSPGGGDNGFGSLVGVATAIMEDRVRVV